MLIFVGPTASGKTTLMRLLCRKIRERGGKCVYFVSSPFGGPAYFITILLSKVLIYAYKLDEALNRKKRLAVLEIVNPRLLSRVLPLLITVDLIFKVVQQAVFTVLEKVGFTLLVEDYYPQMIADHLAYYKLYRSDSKTLRSLITLEQRIFYRYATKARNATCIHVYAEEVTRVLRGLKRSRGSLGMGGFYNNVVRNLLPRTVCEYVGLNTRLIIVNGESS